MHDEKPGSGEQTLDETVDDHRECMKALARVEDCLDSPADVKGDWLGRLRQELPRLAETLRSHFTDEEKGALYRSIPVSKPRFADRLERLEDEHRQILEATERAMRTAESLTDPELHQIREYNAQLQLLVATIRRHEAEENEIIVAANWDEVGVGD